MTAALSTRSLKNIALYISAGICLILAGSTLVSALAKEDQPESIANHNYHRVEPFQLKGEQSYQINRRLSGVISARQHADIGFEYGGKVAAIHVDEGDVIKRGTLLAELDTELLKIEATQLQANLADARSRLGLAKSSLKRNLDLKQRGFSSEQRLDELETEKASLSAIIQSIEASLASNRSRIKKSVLTAPFDGIVTRRFVDQGTVVNAGTALVRLQEKGSMEAHVGVPIPLIPAMEKVLKSSTTLPVEINKQIAQAKIIAISADMNPATRTVQARLALPEMANAVNGDLITALLPETIEQPGFWVPISAITDGLRGLWTTYALMPTAETTDGGKIYRLEARDIQVAYTTTDLAYIQGALAEGELIVSGGLNRVVPGQHVISVDKAAVRQPQISTTVESGD